MNIGNLSDLDAVVRQREIAAQIDSGKPFWVIDDYTLTQSTEPDIPNRLLRCFVGTREIGSVWIWNAIPFYGARDEKVVARIHWMIGGTSAKLFDSGLDRIAAAQAWVVACYHDDRKKS